MMAKHEFISAHEKLISSNRLCKLLNVSKAWYHARKHGEPARQEKAQRQETLLEHIRRVFSESRDCYGPLRVWNQLKREGIGCSLYLVTKLIKCHDIRYHKRRKWVPATTDSKHNHRIAPNLLNRNFNALKPNTVWVADISYVATDEGWLYLAAIKDLATCEIVGWSMDTHMKSTLCENALNMALQHRNPGKGLIHHSDRGVQYACKNYRKLLKRHRIKPSMSRKGNCWDNAPMESFFNSLKTECVYRTRFKTIKQAKAALFDYIEVFYNRKRLHSTIGYKTPQEAFNEMTAKAA